MNDFANNHDQQQTRLSQLDASNPECCAWVSANAGCGKTHVLVNRLIRLLLAGAPIESILCLTYTRAAASEMKTRLYERLAEWTTADDETINEDLREIAELTGETMLPDNARRLLSRLLRHAKGVHIQTIHSFCHHLLARFPLEAGLASVTFDIIDDDSASHLQRQAFNDFIQHMLTDSDARLTQAFNDVALGKNEDALQKLLNQAHNQLSDQPNYDENHKDIDTVTEEFLRQEEKHQKALLTYSRFPIHKWFDLNRKRRQQAIQQGLPVWKDYYTVFLTTEGKARKRLGDPTLCQHQQRLLAWQEQLKGCLRTSPSLPLLAEAYRAFYHNRKSRHDALDYHDLIVKTVDLLEQDGGINWVTYKMDQNIDHILIDEAQDTSPLQWRLIKALTQDFFAGAGARQAQRTIFIVGDFKQSIYGFQGAQPQAFHQWRNYYQKHVPPAQWRVRTLEHSFRSNQVILHCVDAVVKHLDMGSAQVPPHRSWRDQPTGRVELWRCLPKVTKDRHAYHGSWLRQNQSDTITTAMTTAEHIAGRLRQLLDSGERLACTGKPIHAGDIMVLFRSRIGIYPQVIKALQHQRIPLAGIDRLQLQDDLAVMDLLALVQFVLLPQDDFNLACLLKSPLCGLDEERLQKLAWQRQGSLWQALQEKSRTDADADGYKHAHDFLVAMRAVADYAPPFEFFQQALVGHRKRQAFISRFGEETDDVINELLHRALHYERHATPSLQGFVNWFQYGSTEIKRDMETRHDKVRLLTIHGAKGLEAPIVILATTDVREKNKKQSENVYQNDNRMFWLGYKDNADAESQKFYQKQQKEDQQESHRLLYVALTRAQERLYIAGFDKKETKKDKDKTQDEKCWYDHIDDAFTSMAEQKVLDSNERLMRGGDNDDYVWCLDKQSPIPQTPPQPSRKAQDSEPALPEWVLPHDKRQKPETRKDDRKRDKQQQDDSFVLSPLQDDKALQRGDILHGLLQRLPIHAASLSQKQREAVIRQLVTRDQADDAIESYVDEIQNLFENPQLASLLAKPCQREITLMSLVEGQLQQHRIDRLIVEQGRVIIIDYKSDAKPPDKKQDMPQAYRRQLQRYKAVVQDVYPDKACEGYVLWTKTARLQPVS